MAGQLVPQSSGTGNAAFAQQGTVDWTALSRSSFTFSVEVMSRFSKAGVEMITCAMGQAMCSQFNVPPEGQRRVTDAISKLKAYSSYGQLLWFGFGVKHIVRSLCETKQGATCAALCACLRVSYSTEMSARVLSLLCDQLMPSDGLSPALAQWGALIDVCSGALSPSKFPVMVDGFCRLALTHPRRRSQYHKATTADALAHALVELSNVSNGNVSSITFEGGYDCGWIAAVAEWLLCLKVKVLTEEGNCLYWHESSHINDSAQVTIVFNTHTDKPNLAKTKELKVVNRSFHLPYNGVSTLIEPFAVHGEVFGMGRSSWSTILEDTFGSAFKMLLSSDTIGIFAKFLLSHTTARSRSPYAVSHYYSIHPTHPWMGPFSNSAASRERAFLLAIANRLPELSPLLDAVEHLERSAGAAAGSDSDQLWKVCGCSRCGRKYRPGICLNLLGMTLTNLILILAHIDVDQTLQPASTGLLMLHEHVVKRDIKIRDASNPNLRDNLRDNLRWEKDDIGDTYRRTFELFTGLTSHNSVHKVRAASAVCHGGVCIWLPALENPLYDPTKQMGLRVVSGKVSFRGRLYREIVDMEEGMVEDMEEEIWEVWSDSVDLIMRRIATHGTTRGSTLVVRETLDVSRLEACIELRSGKTSSAFDTYLDHLGVERPRQLPSELRLGIMKLYGTMEDRIDNSACEVNLGYARSQGLPKADLTTWKRPCPRLAVLLESTTPPRRSYNYPEAGEWVVVITDPNHAAPIVRIFRGDSTLLYYLASLRFGRPLATCLSYFDGCVRCLASSIAIREAKRYEPAPYRSTCDSCEFAISKKKYDRECLIEVYTITENECLRWSAKMAGIYPLSVEHDLRCRHNKIRANDGPLDDDTPKGDSTQTREK